MPGLKACNPGDILQTMENKLVSAGVVTNADPIYWLMANREIEGNATGKRDILFRVVRRAVNDPAQIGGSRIGLRYQLAIECRLRSIQLLDRIGTDKDQLIEHWAYEDAIIAAFEGFHPSDTGDYTGNLLTIEALHWESGEIPTMSQDLKAWGESFGLWRCNYLPKLGGVYTPLG